MKKPKMKIPVEKSRKEKSFQENVMEHLKVTGKKVSSIKRDMRKIIEEEVAKQFDDKKIMLEGLYKEILIQKRLLQEEGKITQKDINKMYEKLKKRAKNG